MTLASLTHLHLLLNHVPTIGLILGLALLVVSLVRNSDDLKRFSLGVFFLVALSAFPTFMSGYAARLTIRKSPGYSEALTETHQAAALLAVIFVEIAGTLAWLGLWQFRRTSHPARWTLPAVLLLSMVALGLMTIAANLGGEITHTEIRAGAAAPEAVSAGLRWLTTPSIESFVSTYRWAWPVCEILHFLGLSLLFGVVLLINLRILGVVKNAAFIDLHRLLPWAVGGFFINAVSGMLFFTSAPQTYTANVAFHWKMVFMVLAGGSALYHTLFDEPWALGPHDDAPLPAKVVAATQLFLWVGVIYFGRMIPYLTGGSAAGALD